MRRTGCSVGVGGAGGGGGYNKPPPAPLSNSNAAGVGRIRFHMPEPNSPLPKDRFGSPRECSPIMSNSLPLSPSHPNNREKAPNPTFQDLHDCSMCLSAYIQSLNTVCGTACRLAQCLAQVASENSSAEQNAGQQLPQMVKEAADLWEGIARAVGVASAAAKTQIIVMLQEVQSRRVDCVDQMRRQELVKHVVQTMLSTFLNLHYQFSGAVIERFTGILQQLMEETIPSNGPCPPTGVVNVEATQHASPPPSGSQMFFQPSSSNMQRPIQHSIPNSNLTPNQLLMQQQIQIQQQQAALHMQLGNPQPLTSQSSSKANSSLETSNKEDNVFISNRQTSNRPWSANPGSPIASHGNSSLTVTPSHGSNNTLSPSFTSAASGINGGSHEAGIRRWSMGGPSTDSWHEKGSSLTPFSLIANRRWSVPEASEHDPYSSSLGFLHPFYSSLGMSGFEWPCGSSSIGSRSQNSFRGSRGTLHAYLDASSARSPSHSRSVTPEQNRRSSVVTNEEVQNVVDLLSMPLSSFQEESSHNTSHLSSISNAASESPEKVSLQRKRLHSSPLNLSCGSSPDSAAIKKLEHRVSTSSEEASAIPSGEFGHQDSISTPLWPPTETVPGVTLTEYCSGDEEKPISSWTDESDEKRNSFTRDSPSRASWPVASAVKICQNWSDIDLEGQGGWPPTFRRHSTDAYISQENYFTAKTRSVEDIFSQIGSP